MEFTPHEKKMVERLRKEEHRWPRVRWICVATTCIILADYGYLAYIMVDAILSNSKESEFFFVLLWPKVLLGAALLGLWIGWLIKEWRGNVTRLLLLKLLDAQLEKDGSKPENQGSS